MIKENIKLPEAFCQRMKELLGREAENFFGSYQNERQYGLRYNPLKCESRDLFEEKQRELGWNLTPVPWCVGGYYYKPNAQPGRHPWHEAGVYYIQEPSAMSAVELLDVRPGQKICDLCAAPGGKTTQIAGKMQGQGLLVSNEYYGNRAKILSQNVERMGIANTVVLNESTEHLAQVFVEFFDRILVDAPCSGEGMFRKEPEAVQEWSLENVALCTGRQQEILDHAAEMLKPGGVLVYSTCTFSPEENERRLCRFLECHPEFSVETSETGEKYFSHGQAAWAISQGSCAGEDIQEQVERSYRLWPHNLRGEGHFAVRLRKVGSTDGEEHTGQGKLVKEHRSKRQTARNKEAAKIEEAVSGFQNFQKETLKFDLEERLPGRYVQFSEHLYLLPGEMQKPDGLKVVRAGLHLGVCKKNRFEPSHALAMYLHPQEVRQYVELSLGTGKTRDSEKYGEALKYLHGETVTCDCGQKGWTLVCVDGFSLGWGKAQNGVVKNHYPKGLRIQY